MNIIDNIKNNNIDDYINNKVIIIMVITIKIIVIIIRIRIRIMITVSQNNYSRN